jgi:uncharacterized membrane protein
MVRILEENKMNNKLGLFAIFAIVAILMSSIALASTAGPEHISVEDVEINGHSVDGDLFAVDEGETLDIELKLRAKFDVEDVRVSAEISGYEYSDYQDLEDATHLFDMREGTTKFVDLSLELPLLLDRDDYTLRLRITDKNNDAQYINVDLFVEPTRHGLKVADVVFSPGNTVQAGRSLLTTVLVQNFGDRAEENVKVTVSIPELGVSAADFVDIIETEEDVAAVSYETTEELFLRVPECAAPGIYRVDVSVKYDEFETVTESYALEITSGSTCVGSANRLLVGVGPEAQTVVAGSEAVYTIALSNEGTSAETFTLDLVTGDWAASSLSQSVVVLGAGESAVVYAHVNVADDASGAQVANLVIANNGRVLESIGLTASVQEGASATSGINLRNGLELALIIIVVLVIIIGLIVGFARLRKDEDEEQTYY